MKSAKRITAIFTFCIVGSLVTYGQTAVATANECYQKGDYACALDNYQRAYLSKDMKAGEEYLVFLRIGYCFNKLGRREEAKQFYYKSIAHKADYRYSWEYLGNLLYNTKKYDSAAICYTRTLQYVTSQEDKDLLNFYLGEAYFSNANNARSIVPFSSVVSRKDDFARTDKYIGEAYYLMAKYDSALFFIRKAYNDISPQNKNYTGLLLLHGRVYRAKKEYDSAVITFNKLLIANPNDALAKWETGIVYASKKDYAQAADWYHKAMPAYEKDTSNYYVLLSNTRYCYQNMGQYDKAVSYYPKMIAYSRNPLDDMKLMAGLQYGKLKRYADAEATCKQLLSRALAADTTRQASKDQRLVANTILGRTALIAKDTAKAIAYLTEALRLNKYSLEPNLAMSDIYFARNSSDANSYLLNAYTTRDTMLTSNADYARFYGRRAVARYAKDANNKSGIKLDAEDALKYDSLQKEAIKMWPIGLVGDYSYDSKRDRCLALMAKGIAAYSSDKPYVSELYNSRAYFFSTQNDTLQTLANLKKSLDFNQNNMQAWDNLLKFYNSTQRYNDGIKAVETLVPLLKKTKENASLAVAYLYKGDYLWKMGQKDQAKAAYAEAQLYAPNDETIKNRLKMQ